MFGLFTKKAAIIRHQLGETEVSPDFDSIQKANRAVSEIIKANDGIVIRSEYNEFDGKEMTSLEKVGNTTWEETEYIVYPSNELSAGGDIPL